MFIVILPHMQYFYRSWYICSATTPVTIATGCDPFYDQINTLYVLRYER